MHEEGSRDYSDYFSFGAVRLALKGWMVWKRMFQSRSDLRLEGVSDFRVVRI